MLSPATHLTRLLLDCSHEHAEWASRYRNAEFKAVVAQLQEWRTGQKMATGQHTLNTPRGMPVGHGLAPFAKATHLTLYGGQIIEFYIDVTPRLGEKKNLADGDLQYMQHIYGDGCVNRPIARYTWGIPALLLHLSMQRVTHLFLFIRQSLLESAILVKP